MDAIVMLREDHKIIESQFKSVEKGRLSVVPDICQALVIHATLEEELFYPQIRSQIPDIAEDVAEALEEHHVVRLLTTELARLDPDDESYRAKATVLMELVRHHVEEEEGEMFPEIRRQLGRSWLKDLGEQMQARRDALAE